MFCESCAVKPGRSGASKPQTIPKLYVQGTSYRTSGQTPYNLFLTAFSNVTVQIFCSVSVSQYIYIIL
jgi:hypothetical protein